MDPDYDVDYFRLELSEAADVVIRSSGFPDTEGELWDSGGQLPGRGRVLDRGR